MKIESSESWGVVVARLIGRVDLNSADAFSAALAPLLARCTKDAAPLVLDAAGLTYISSVGLRVLMMASRQIRSQEGKIALAALNPVVEEVFTITRFNQVIPCHPSVQAASAALLS